IDNTLANEKEGVYFAAFGEKAPVGSELLLVFNDKFPPGKEIHISFVLFEEDLNSPGSHGGAREQVSPSAQVVWAYLNDGKWKTITPKKDTTLALTRSGRIVFTGPSDMDKKDYWIRCRLEKGRYEIVPQINRIL
ncbi:MAG: hypothetical protein IMF19_01650, partial [Proteobacteria bacterium]|nr:hypothetical protein [Pseudomonadota bacterium]